MAETLKQEAKRLLADVPEKYVVSITGRTGEICQSVANLLSEGQVGKYPPELMRGLILKQLGGHKLQLLKCTYCQARFAVDKLPKQPIPQNDSSG